MSYGIQVKTPNGISSTDNLQTARWLGYTYHDLESYNLGDTVFIPGPAGWDASIGQVLMLMDGENIAIGYPVSYTNLRVSRKGIEIYPTETGVEAYIPDVFASKNTMTRKFYLQWILIA